MICPDCNGKRDQDAIVRGKPRIVTCFRCKGEGTVPDAMAGWIIAGLRLRDKRVNGKPYRSLHEEAKRRGLDTVTLSKMEMGKIEPLFDEEDCHQG